MPRVSSLRLPILLALLAGLFVASHVARGWHDTGSLQDSIAAIADHHPTGETGSPAHGRHGPDAGHTHDDLPDHSHDSPGLLLALPSVHQDMQYLWAAPPSAALTGKLADHIERPPRSVVV